MQTTRYFNTEIFIYLKKERPAIQKKVLPPLEAYLRNMVYSELTEKNVRSTLRKIRKFNSENEV